MILLLLFLMPNVWRIHLGNDITSRMIILWELTNYVFPNVLFICYFCKNLMEEDWWDTLDGTRHLLHSPITIFGPRCSATSHASPTDALYVAKLSLKLNLMAFICPFQFHIIHGKISVWTLCFVCLELEMERIPYLLFWTNYLNGTFHPMQ